MRSTTSLLIIFLFISWLSGCGGGTKDEASEVELIPPQQQTPEKTDGDFFPLKVGNEWIYGDGTKIITERSEAAEIRRIVLKQQIAGSLAFKRIEYLPPYSFPLNENTFGKHQLPLPECIDDFWRLGGRNLRPPKSQSHKL